MSIFNYIIGETPASSYSGESTILVKNSSSQYQEIPANAFLSSTSPDIGLITAAVGPVSLTFESGSDCKGLNNKAFRNGPGLTSAVFPPSIIAIDAQAFSLNPPYSPANPSQGLSSVTFTDIANSGLTTINNSTFYGQSNLTSITLPPSLETIGEEGFAVPTNSGGLISLTFHDIANSRLNTISDDAFRNTSLTSIILPASLENIGIDAFNISTLNSVTFDDISLSRLENIGLEAFRNATISTITIPNHVKSIGTSAFFGSDGMTVNINSTVVKTLGIAYSDTTFFGATGVRIVEYPVVTTPPPVIIFPYPKIEKNKRLLGVNQKISSGLARPNFKFQTNQFSAGRSRTAQSKQKANGPVTVIFPIR